MARSSPFGKESRVRILKQHFQQSGQVTAHAAWKFVYEELLWADGSTGLAHLYESDKAQPGRPWYRRTALFTDLLCQRFGDITQEELKQRIDKLFRACLQKLIETAKLETGESDLAETLAVLQETPQNILKSGSLPLVPEVDAKKSIYEPDAELVAEFSTLLAHRVNLPQSEVESLARTLVARARLYFTVERKRQNVLGEGFEDLLQLLLIEVGKVPADYIRIRTRADKLPGFSNLATTRERNESPDIAIVKDGTTRLLATVKWSLRHDRQKQLSDELDCYVDLLSQPTFSTYILVTNEYDPGRLINTDGLNRRGQKIDCIYHINLELLFAVLDDHASTKRLEHLVAVGRLKSLEDLFPDLIRIIQ